FLAPATAAIYSLSLHDALPICANFGRLELDVPPQEIAASVFDQVRALAEIAGRCGARLIHVKPHGALYNQAARDRGIAQAIAARSEEHTSELQSRENLVCRLLL